MTGSTQFAMTRAVQSDWACFDELQARYFANDPTGVDEKEFYRLCGEDGGCVFVARAERTYAGHVVMRRKSIFPWESIAFVAVDPRFGRKGVGTRLTETAIARSPRPFMRLHVRRSNVPALSIYRKLGFRVIGKRNANYDDGEDALVMMCWTGLSVVDGEAVEEASRLVG